MAYREEFEQGAKGAPEPIMDRQPVQDPEAEQAVKAAGQGAPAQKDVVPAKAKSRRKPIIMALAGAALLFGGYEGYHWWTDGRFMVSTDDAYIEGDIATISPKVSGYVAKVDAVANQKVKAGDPLVTLDDGDYRIAAEQAEAKIATQKLALSRAVERFVEQLAPRTL